MDLSGYVDVKTRLRFAMSRNPDLRIQASRPTVVTVDGQSFIEVTVTVWRDPFDPLPAIATAWEPFPGKSPFTRNSEMMNAETSALGRALAFVDVTLTGEVPSLASREEVRNRAPDGADDAPVPSVDSRRSSAADGPAITPRQAEIIAAMSRERGLEPPDDLPGWTAGQASEEIDRLKTVPKVK